MATYAQLESEQVWHDQVVPVFMTSFLIVPLRNFYGMGADLIGAPGDNNHLYGRHRSADWDRTSRYCTNRSYGTVDPRDHEGNQDWYRAVDVGIQGQTLYDACRRVDAAVRAGQLPELAEWFGTFDGHTVVGWYEGHPSSSDSSHLYHLHLGFWNQHANEFAVMQRVFGIVTGQAAPPTPEPEEEPMPRIARDTAGQNWIGDGIWRKAITGQQATNWIQGGAHIPYDGDVADIDNYGRDVAEVGGTPAPGVAAHTHEGGTSGPVAE